jgi:hypothetical protein
LDRYVDKNKTFANFMRYYQVNLTKNVFFITIANYILKKQLNFIAVTATKYRKSEQINRETEEGRFLYFYCDPRS